MKLPHHDELSRVRIFVMNLLATNERAHGVTCINSQQVGQTGIQAEWRVEERQKTL